MRRFLPQLTAVLALTLASTAAPAARAQTDLYRWNRPVVAETVLWFPGEGAVEGETLYLPLGRRIEIEAQAVDQSGRRFPQKFFRFGFDLEQGCNGLVALEGIVHGTITVKTGKQAGSCGLLFWVPNNMNLDRQMRVEVGRPPPPPQAPPAAEAIDTREELVAVSLFRAILGREPDAQWLAAAAEQVRRNETRDQIRSLLSSPEFSARRRTVSPEGLLRDFYVGLLGREPDPSGMRSYRDEMHAGKFEEVIVDILSSNEFRERVARELR
jgi:hypothetical protein